MDNYYVDPKKFTQEVQAHSVMARKALKKKKTPPQPNRYVSDCIMKMSYKYATKGNWNGYSWKEDMVGDAIEVCVRTLNNGTFDPTRENAFAYFTSIIHNAFIARWKEEKGQLYSARKYLEHNYTNYVQDGNEGVMFQNYKEFMEHTHDTADFFERRNTKEYRAQNKGKNRRGPKGKSIRIDGILYDTKGEAAKALDISISTFNLALKELGNRSNYEKRHFKKKRSTKYFSKPVIIDGKEYTTTQSIAEYTGLCAQVIRNRLTMYRKMEGLTKEDFVLDGTRSRREIIVDGKTYKSGREIADDLNLAIGTVNSRIREMKKDEYTLKDFERRHGGHPLQPVTIDGITYPSRKKAADAIGVSIGKINWEIKTNPKKRYRLKDFADRRKMKRKKR